MKYFAPCVIALLACWPSPAQPGSADPLVAAAAKGEVKAVQSLLAAGAQVNAATPSGKTALIEAAERGRTSIARLLIAAGADLNLSDRGVGTALEAAERAGHAEVAALLRSAGARTSGRSVGDTVCVRPWKGDGYCGVVEGIVDGQYRLRITEVIGCRDGCAAREGCSAGKPVGSVEGLRPGERVSADASCLTHTGARL